MEKQPIHDAPSAAAERFPARELETLIARYGWFAPLRVLREVRTGKADALLAVTAPWRGRSSLRQASVELMRFAPSASEEAIDRFLQQTDLRIVAEEGEPDVEVRTAPELTDADEVVSEQLAEIYLAQGVPDRAVAIYRKLSLLNPEKSIYFAELIGKIENNN